MTLCVAFIDKENIGHLVADSGAYPENKSQPPMRGHLKIMSASIVTNEDCQTVGVAFAGNEGPLIQKIISSGLTVHSESIEMLPICQAILDEVNKFCAPEDCYAYGISLLIIGFCRQKGNIRIFSYSSLTNRFTEEGTPGHHSVGVIGDTNFVIRNNMQGSNDLTSILNLFEQGDSDPNRQILLPLSHGRIVGHNFIIIQNPQ